MSFSSSSSDDGDDGSALLGLGAVDNILAREGQDSRPLWERILEREDDRSACAVCLFDCLMSQQPFLTDTAAAVPPLLLTNTSVRLLILDCLLIC